MNMNHHQMTDTDGKSGMSEQQKQNIKKYVVFTVMGIICVGCIYLIFSPTVEDKAKTEAVQGYNADIPMPKDDDIIGDKREAYQQEQIQQRQEQRMRSLDDFSAMLGDVNLKTDEVSITTDTESTPNTSVGNSRSVPQNRSQSSIQNSAQAYNEMNRTLGSFYEKPREDPEKEKLKQELEELKMQIDEAQKNSVNEQLELMEKSFQMAAKYIPGSSGTSIMLNDAVSEPASTSNNNTSGKTVVVPVAQVSERTVSTLLPEMNYAEFIEIYSQPRNMGFLSVTSETGAGMKNTIFACIHADQTIMDGQNVRLRLLEPMQAGNVVIPRNSILTGTARIQGERLSITINSLEHAGTIITVELRAYDLDGQSGIFIPNMSELKAAKEIVANMGTSAGTSITLADDAGKQFAADMGRNVIQGVSQFTAKKLREVKVHLKDGYRVYLLANK